MADSIHIGCPVERKFVCMQRTTFDPILRFFQDDAHEVPLPLADHQFRFVVADKAGAVILELSTDDEGGITIENENELHFLDDLEVGYGLFHYTFLMTYEEVTRPVMYGEFLILKNNVPVAG